MSAHLDTVSRRHGLHRQAREGRGARPHRERGAGLAALVALAGALRECEIGTAGSLLFVGTVGEEGEGDLRGARHLLTAGEWAGKIDAFVSLDGPGVERITSGAVGSRRYRVRFTGAGGHSWGDFGAANPVHALSRAVARLVSYPAPARPRTTFNFGRRGRTASTSSRT